ARQSLTYRAFFRYFVSPPFRRRQSRRVLIQRQLRQVATTPVAVAVNHHVSAQRTYDWPPIPAGRRPLPPRRLANDRTAACRRKFAKRALRLAHAWRGKQEKNNCCCRRPITPPH